MRAIDRGEAPLELKSLVKAQPGRRWNSAGEKDTHTAIAETLRHKQHRLCGYCEGPLRERGHVEHIHPRMTEVCTTRISSNHHYDWQNLLLVCGSSKHCDGPKAGRDLCGEVLFPDRMDPEARYWDISSLDGEMRVIDGLPAEIRAAAERSIEELMLNDPVLKKMRVDVIQLIQEELNDLKDESMVRHRVAYSGFPTTVEFYFSK